MSLAGTNAELYNIDLRNILIASKMDSVFVMERTDSFSHCLLISDFFKENKNQVSRQQF